MGVSPMLPRTKQLQMRISCTIIGIVFGVLIATHGFASVETEEQICIRKSKSKEEERTRCSPRTRMLTCMLMAQMSKHMDMRSCRTLL